MSACHQIHFKLVISTASPLPQVHVYFIMQNAFSTSPRVPIVLLFSALLTNPSSKSYVRGWRDDSVVMSTSRGPSTYIRWQLTSTYNASPKGCNVSGLCRHTYTDMHISTYRYTYLHVIWNNKILKKQKQEESSEWMSCRGIWKNRSCGTNYMPGILLSPKHQSLAVLLKIKKNIYSVLWWLQGLPVLWGVVSQSHLCNCCRGLVTVLGCWPQRNTCLGTLVWGREL